MIDLTNKNAIITGSTRGIGRNIAEKLASSGANVVITGTRQEKCDEVAREIQEKYKVKTLAIQTDVSNLESIQTLISKTIEELGSIQILVNNAGITKDNLLLRMKPEDFDSVIQTNLNSVFYSTKTCLRPMLKQRYGRIINVTSIVGIMGNAGQGNYAASKAGVIGFTKSIAKEVGAKGITINAVAPGFIETDMIKSLPEEYINNIISSIPLKRLGTPDDVSNLVAFLASDLASYITGQAITVGGGILM
jgi:3-oxoacyl-[acyl-carrier protein] reductase